MISRCGELLACTQRVPVAAGDSKSGNTFFSSEPFPYRHGGTLSGTDETLGGVRPWRGRGCGLRGARPSAPAWWPQTDRQSFESVVTELTDV